jgi:CheY-like chemotaxis protein
MARLGRMILLVEHDEVLMSVWRLVLRVRRYRVTSASSSSEALRIMNSDDGDSVDIVLTELSMPGVDGNALIRKIKSTRPDVRSVVMARNIDNCNREIYSDSFLHSGCADAAHVLAEIKRLSQKKRGPKPKPDAKYRMEHMGKGMGVAA